jgi:hypothetical protein
MSAMMPLCICLSFRQRRHAIFDYFPSASSDFPPLMPIRFRWWCHYCH